MDLKDVKMMQKYMHEYRKQQEKKETDANGGKDKPALTPEPKYDYVNSLENSEATILYVVAMVVSTIFRGNWILWIIWTIIWLKYINRHN